jgi:hypothetical protein
VKEVKLLALQPKNVGCAFRPRFTKLGLVEMDREDTFVDLGYKEKPRHWWR